jgi:hypothetical protein
MDTELMLVVAALVAAGAGIAVALIVRRAMTPGESSTEVAAALAAQAARLDRLADGVGRQAEDDRELRQHLHATRGAVEAVRLQAEERRRGEEEAWRVVRRMEATLLGGSARGAAGENVLGEALAALPPEMLVRDFPVNGKRVEFALVLPDGRRMPVDSKWAAEREVAALDEEEDPEARRLLARKLEDEVARRAREVAAYLEPSLTTPFAVACVPDAAFAACRKAHADAFSRGVVLVSYSTALPVLLALYTLAARHGAVGDADGALAEMEGLLSAMEQTLENKVARAVTMLQNAAGEWREHIGRGRGALARGRVSPMEERPPLEAVE